MKRGESGHVKDQAGRDARLFDLLKGLIDLFQVSFLKDTALISQRDHGGILFSHISHTV
jgi:hypothetical protein